MSPRHHPARHLTLALALPVLGLLAPVPAALAEGTGSDTLSVAPRPVVTLHAGPELVGAGTFIGTVEATTTVGTAFEILGRLVSRPVNEGDLVARGDLLATLDARTLQDDCDAAQAALASAEATLATASKARARVVELVQRGADSAQTLEAAERNAAVALADVEQARAGLARAEDALARTRLIAPMDGIVLRTRHETGATVAAGDPVLVLASPTGRKVTLTLPATVLGGLAPGARFIIRSPDLPGGSTIGTLSLIDPVPAPETRMRAVEVALGPEAGTLAIGQLVEVSPLAPAGSHVVLPRAAIRDGEDGPRVWVVDTAADGGRRVHSLTVRLSGDAAGREDEIPVEGIPEGAEVVVRGVHSLAEGQAVGPAVTANGRNPAAAPPAVIVPEAD